MLLAGQASEDHVNQSIAPDLACEQKTVLRSVALRPRRKVAPLARLIGSDSLFLTGAGVESDYAGNDPIPAFPCSGGKAGGVEHGRLRREAVGRCAILTGSQPPQGAEAEAMNDHACPAAGAPLRASSRL